MSVLLTGHVNSKISCYIGLIVANITSPVGLLRLLLQFGWTYNGQRRI